MRFGNDVAGEWDGIASIATTTPSSVDDDGGAEYDVDERGRTPTAAEARRLREREREREMDGSSDGTTWGTTEDGTTKSLDGSTNDDAPAVAMTTTPTTMKGSLIFTMLRQTVGGGWCIVDTGMRSRSRKRGR